MDLPECVLQLANRQRGIVTRRDLLHGGVSAKEVRWWTGRTWRLVLPGVLLLGWGLPDVEQRRIAALQYAGPRSWLSGLTAAEIHGFLEPRTDQRTYVLVPAPLRPRDVGWLSIRRTHLVDERLLSRGALRYSSAARSVVDGAATLPSDQARALVISSVQRRAVRVDDVSHWIEARRPNGRRALRAMLAEAAAGAWSLPEADLARLVATSRVLPPAWLNPQLHDVDGRRLTTPDLWFDDVGLAVMVHSRRFHADVFDWDATVDQDSDLSAARVVVVGVTPTALARDPPRVLARVEAAYLAARRSGLRAPVLATRRVVLAAPA